MLSGKIVYKDTYKLDVDAVDSSSVMQLLLTSASQNALNLMQDPQATDDTSITERRANVQMSSIVVETGTHLENGKNKKDPVNNDFFCRLGALIRYAKSKCNSKTEIGYSGLSLASKEFEAVSDREYDVKLDDGSDFAKVKLSYGDIVELHITTSDFDINIVENKRETKIFPKIVNGMKLGIKFDEEYLGFPIAKQVIEEADDNNELYSGIEEIIEANPNKEFKWLLGKDYRIIDDEHLEEVCNYIMSPEHEYVYYDTETSGLDITFKSRTGDADQLVGVVLSVKFGESFFFPTQMKSIPNLCGGDHFYFMEHYMRPILEGKKLVAHNMSFDWKVAYIYDINANIVHDTMALIKLTLGAEKGKNFLVNLKHLAKILLGRDSLELSDLIKNNSWGETDIKFWDLPYELVRLYACADTDNTMGLLMYAQQMNLLGKYNATKVYEIEIAFSFAVAYQEFYGHRIDIHNVSSIRADLGAEQDQMMKEMTTLLGHTFNPNSPAQLQQALYTEMKVPVQYNSKSGKVTTDKKALDNLANLTDIEGNAKYPFCVALKKYRELESVRKVVDKFPEHMTNDGFIFSQVQQYGTDTGRVSIKDPNYQSYNDTIKKNVVPREGYWMFDTDYSSVEYRVLANVVGNKQIMESFKDPDFDYHTYQAAHMYNIPYSAVTKKLRKSAKHINFGLPYGMGDASLGEGIYGEKTPENTAKAAKLREAYFKGQDDIKDWFTRVRDKAVANGYSETYFGRRRYYFSEKDSEGSIRRQAGNQPIQGSAADIYKMAVGRVFKRVCKEGWLGKVLFTGFIHDELLGEVTNDIDPAKFLKILREEFEVKITNPDGTPWCPLYMGFGYGMSWYEAKSVELPIKLQWEIVEKYSDTGFPQWHGNGREFCDTVPDMLRDFEVRDIRNQITAPESQDKEIKPALNTALLDCLKTDAKSYVKGIQEYADEMGWALDSMEDTEKSAWLSNNKDDIVAELDKKYHIQNLYEIDGEYQFSFEPSTETQEALTQYCKLHNVDRSTIHINNIQEVDVDASNLADAQYLVSDDDVTDENELQKIKDNRVATLGMYVDIDAKQVILKLVPAEYLSFIKNKANHEGKGYNIMFKDTDKNQLFVTKAYLDSPDIPIIQELYIQFFNSVRQ